MQERSQRKEAFHIIVAVAAMVLLLLVATLGRLLGWIAPDTGPPSGGLGNPGEVYPGLGGSLVAGFLPNIGTGTTTPIARLTVANGNLVQGSGYIDPIVVGGHTTPATTPGLAGLPASGPNSAITDVYTNGNYAYVVTNMTDVYVIDVSNPTNPAVVTSFTPNSGDTIKKIIIRGNILYALHEAGGSDGTLSVVNIANPFSPVIQSTTIDTTDYGVSIPSTVGGCVLPCAVDFDIEGNYAYIAFNDDGDNAFRIIDLEGNATNGSIPDAIGGDDIVNESNQGGLPTEDTGRWPTTPKAVGIDVKGKYAYILFNESFGATFNNSLRIIDVSNPKKPISIGGRRLVNGVPVPEFSIIPKIITVQGEYAYIGFEPFGTYPAPQEAYLQSLFRVVDLSDKWHPKIVGGHQLSTQDDWLLSGTTTDPTFGKPSFSMNDMAIAGKYIYAAINTNPYDSGVFGNVEYQRRQMRIIDIHDPENPQIVGGKNLTLNMPQTPTGPGPASGNDDSPTSIFVQGRYAYMGFEYEDSGGDAFGKSRAFRIVDITGIESTSLYAHALETGRLTVEGNTFVDGEFRTYGGLSVGADTLINGIISVFGDVFVRGNAKGARKLFRIDHPLDPEHKILQHVLIESNQYLNLYDGIIVLDKSGEGVVQLSDYMEALNTDFTYLLTPISSPAPNLYIKEKMHNNQFTIAGGDPGVKVSWQITGVRKDPYAVANPIIVEEQKETPHYLNPRAFEE